MKDRVVLAMSGGVDSSVAAHLLLEQGYEVVGVFMRHGEEWRGASCDSAAAEGAQLPILDLASSRQGCCTAEDAADARRVADRFGIPFYALDLHAEFERIIRYFVDEYSVGRTPNPCVVCNQWIKFGKLFDYADAVGARFVATGHYARCADSPDGSRALWRGVDADKDQSYALFGVARRYVERMLLPVGGYRKPEIRELAARIGLRVAEKRDSQEICFVRPGEHPQLVRTLRGTSDTSGPIVTTDGQVVGTHSGIEGFTIGQRKGLGVAFGEPRFVVAIDAPRRQVVVGRHAELARPGLTASQCNWLIVPPEGEFACQVQIRYNSDAQPARARVLPDDRLEVTFDEACFGVAPGQAAVCYDGDRVLGGGWIDSYVRDEA